MTRCLTDSTITATVWSASSYRECGSRSRQTPRVSSRPPEPPIMHPEALWDLQAIKAWARYKSDTQARAMVSDPEFPRPVRILGDASHPRWIAGEVWDFVK